MYLIGIDIGSTSIKAVIFKYNGEIVSIGRRRTEVFTVKNIKGIDEYFWIPDNIWSKVSEAIKDAISHIDYPERISGIAVSGFGQDGVPLDENGNYLYPFISWHDNKTLEQLSSLLDLINEKEIYKICGSRAWHIDSIFRNMWVKKHEPLIYKKICKWVLITDYINYKLCGKIATEYSESSTTLALDQNNLEWSKKIFKAADVNMDIYPDLYPSGKLLGHVNTEASKCTGLKVGTPVILGGHDNNCGAFASGALINNNIVSITGTFESNIIFTDKPVMTMNGMKRNLICEKSVVENKYILLGYLFAGGVVEWFKKNFYSIKTNDSDSDFYLLLRNLDDHTNVGSNGVFMLPDIIGCFNPILDNKSLGVFVGVSEKTKMVDFLRAIIEGINFQSYLVCNAITETTRTNFNEVINIGGASDNKFWMQNKADIFGKTIKASKIKEETALGAAMLAGIGTGIYKNYSDAISQIICDYNIYYPDNQKHEKYCRYFNNIYKEIYKANKTINHQIYKEFLK